jgi:oxalate decarboxylase/phosphoglucose isomerase-like protein (cupin superfamily)
MTTTIGGDEVAFRVTAQESAGALTALDVRLPPGGGPPVLHRHAPYELYRVESGELAFYLEDDDGAVRRSVAGPGSLVSIPGGREHTVRNESAADAQAFVVFSPGEQMESFARAAHDRPEDVMALASAHGIEITRPVEEVA